MAFTYELAREEYQVASDKLKLAIGPYKTARVCSALSSVCSLLLFLLTFFFPLMFLRFSSS